MVDYLLVKRNNHIFVVVYRGRARIHTRFHRFTEIGQIFHNKYIFSKNFKLSKLKSGKWFGQSVNVLSK